jgi:hypothetical protein
MAELMIGIYLLTTFSFGKKKGSSPSTEITTNYYINDARIKFVITAYLIIDFGIASFSSLLCRREWLITIILTLGTMMDLVILRDYFKFSDVWDKDIQSAMKNKKINSYFENSFITLLIIYRVFRFACVLKEFCKNVKLFQQSSRKTFQTSAPTIF